MLWLTCCSYLASQVLIKTWESGLEVVKRPTAQLVIFALLMISLIVLFATPEKVRAVVCDCISFDSFSVRMHYVLLLYNATTIMISLGLEILAPNSFPFRVV